MKVCKMKEKLQRFMVGRYGFDDLSRIFLGITVACMAASLFMKNQMLYLLGLALLIYIYFRSFSRNIEKRRQENQRFCNFRYQRVVKWNKWKERQAQKKIYRFYQCPQCSQNVRVPKGKGKICITCPKCQFEFIKKS